MDQTFIYRRIDQILTEDRAAMHWAFRLPKQDQDYPELAELVHQQLDRMYQLVVDKVHAGPMPWFDR